MTPKCHSQINPILFDSINFDSSQLICIRVSFELVQFSFCLFEEEEEEEEEEEVRPGDAVIDRAGRRPNPIK